MTRRVRFTAVAALLCAALAAFVACPFVAAWVFPRVERMARGGWPLGAVQALLIAVVAAAACVVVGVNLAWQGVLLMLPAAKPTVSPAGREFTPEEILAVRALPDSSREWLTAHGWVDPETVYSFDGAGRKVGYMSPADDMPDYGPVPTRTFRPGDES